MSIYVEYTWEKDLGNKFKYSFFMCMLEIPRPKFKHFESSSQVTYKRIQASLYETDEFVLYIDAVTYFWNN